MYNDDFIEVGITDDEKGNVTLHSTDKRFREEYPNGRTISKSLLHYIMIEIASWINNDLDAGCLFYMD